MGHTPGPWLVREPDNDEHTEVYAEATGIVCFPEPNDAYLIAAAPEMLAALKRVIAEANCAMDYIGVDAEHTLKRALERISKAKCVCEQTITKAEGRTDAD